MRLSIIIPVYNVEKYISKCLDSILNQDLFFNDYEIIIINDGSTDDSLRIAEKYATGNSNIRVINRVNGGVGSARNCGMDNATGKYIYFIDPDDYLHENCLKTLVETCEREDLDILTFLTGPFSPVPLKIEALSETISRKVINNDKLLSPILTGEKYVTEFKFRNEVWWYLIRREFLIESKVQFIENHWLEDAIFTTELLLKAKRIAHLKLDAHVYMTIPGSAMTSKEPTHYNKLIRDMQNAAVSFETIIKSLENKEVHADCIARIKAKQQSLVFFSMIRMLKSTMKFTEVKLRVNEMMRINAFPLDSFLGKDYNGVTYQIWVRLFKTDQRFYLIFKIVNPILRLKHKIVNPT